MRKGKFHVILTILFALSIVLSACTGGGANNDNGAQGGDDNTGENAGGNNGDQVTLSVWAMGEEGKLLSEFAKNFENDHPNIKINVQSIPWANAHDKLLTAVSSRKGPDVLQIGTTWVPEFARAGTFLDLTQYESQYDNFNPDNFYEGALLTSKVNDQTIGIPWYVDTRVLFYRTDLLADAGYPNGPETWSDTKDAAAKLAAREGDVFGIDIDRKDQNVPLMFAWEHGWTYDIEKGAANYADEDFVRAMELYTSFFTEGLAPTTSDIEITQAFKEGIKPMFISGPWMVRTIEELAPELEGKWAVKLMPEETTRDSLIGGAHMTVFHNSPNVEQALEFINYLADPQTQVEWFKTSRALPAVKAAWEDPALQEDERLSVFGEQLNHTQTTPMIPEYERVATELLRALEKVIVGGTDLNQALADFRKEADRILK